MNNRDIVTECSGVLDCYKYFKYFCEIVCPEIR